MVREIKEKMCFTATDRSHFKKLYSAKDSQCVVMYKLPDGTSVKLDHERYLCPEILFEPDSEIHTGKSLPHLIESSVNDIDMTLRREMYSCVIVSGGSSFFPKFTDRLQRELLSLTPPGVHHVQLCAYPQRRHQEWLGGSMLASLSSFQKDWVSVKDYEEHGPNIICRNNFF
ncbi:unnamed protein product [Lymnaea stagnalis]|uniref:Uncharacterized protein n=1 Tax=Lymnaea stagnalis TaxID=6523 RepID=A0AAV2IN59_LYMST